MTQIIFQAIVACCCIYTVYRLSLFVFRRLSKGRKNGKGWSATFLLKRQT